MTRTIGSSDVAAILGESPWSSPWSVWSRLVGLTERESSANDDTEQQDGRLLEPGILLKYQRDEQAADMLPGPPVEMPAILNAREPWMSCHPDALRMQARVVVEAKAPRTLQTDEWGPSGSTHAPRYYILQGVWLMAVTDFDRTDIVAFARYDREDRWRVYPIPRRERLEQGIIARVRDWREQYVLTGQPPPIDGSDACAKALARRNTDHVAKTWRTASRDDLAIARDLLHIRRQIADLRTQERINANMLRNAIGDDYGLRGPDGEEVATHGVAKGRVTIDAARLREERPDVAVKYSKTGDAARRFRFPFDPNDPEETDNG